jgi:hypothetical protein
LQRPHARSPLHQLLGAEGSPAIADAEGPLREQASPFVLVWEDRQVWALDMRPCPRGRDARGVSMDLDFTVIFGSNVATTTEKDITGGSKPPFTGGF